MRLKNKRILLGVCGSIAAYKSVFLTRLLVKEGAEVRVIMTPDAKSFVGPLTFSTLSRNPVESQYFDPQSGVWINHVDLGHWADLMLIAPASANTIAKMRAGICDNLLLAVYLSARCPVMIAPAMDLEMYQHPSLKENLETLVRRGNILLHAEHGELASGLSGQGRMAEPEHILDSVIQFLQTEKVLTGKRILVNAGPTHEPIDPVRFIGNRSSGKMGISVANALDELGAQVELVLGPVDGSIAINKNIRQHHVQRAEEMYDRCMELFGECDGAVLAAAVADYTPLAPADRKIKKSEGELDIRLKRTKDILAAIGKSKGDKLVVGFALETDHELEHAREKLIRKNADLIVLNSLNEEGAGFSHNTNRVDLVSKDGVELVPLMEKTEVGRRIAAYVAGKLKN